MTMTAGQYIERVIDAMPRVTPHREQIAMELRGHIAERVSNGQSLADVIVQLGAIVLVLLFTRLLARSDGVWVVLLLIVLIGTTIVFFFYTITAETLFSQTI